MQNEIVEDTDIQNQTENFSSNSMFVYRVLLGEYCLLQKEFDGQVFKPNVYAYPPGTPESTLSLLNNNQAAHIVSMPCTPAVATGITQKDGKILYTYKIFNRMSVDVSGDYNEYLGNFRKRSLSSLKRKVKKAEKSNDSQPSVRTFDAASDVREFVELAKPISMVSYQEAQLGTVFRTDDEWIKELETLARQNRFRGYVLYLENQPVAYNYCPVYGDGIMLYDLSGYIPDFQRYSPGTVLQSHIIKHAFDDPSIRIYDLCEGEGRHKEQFSTDSTACCNVYVFPKTPYYWALAVTHRSLDRLSTTMVGLLNRLGFKDRIKTYLRRGK